MKSIVEQIFDHAWRQPEKIAVSDGKTSLSYSQLKRYILFSKELLEDEYELRKGDSVIIAANKQLSFLAVYFACHLIGATVVPIAPDTNLKRFYLIYSKVSPRLVVGFNSEIIKCYTAELDRFELDDDYIAPEAVLFPSMSMNADIIFTTGTTGDPKGVQLTHENIAAAALNINTFIQNTHDDVELLALPISHSFGLGRMRCALSNGQTLIVLGSFANMKRFFKYIDEFRVTGFGMVPASWAMIKKCLEKKYLSLSLSFII